jgi:Tfp pilus assembly protein PilN
MDKKFLNKVWSEARSEDMMSAHSVNKYAFQSLLVGMISKLKESNSERAIKQLAIMRRMESFLERLTHFNCLFIFQAKIITNQELRIVLLEQEKEELIDEIEKIKKINKW